MISVSMQYDNSQATGLNLQIRREIFQEPNRINEEVMMVKAFLVAK